MNILNKIGHLRLNGFFHIKWRFLKYKCLCNKHMKIILLLLYKLSMYDSLKTYKCGWTVDFCFVFVPSKCICDMWSDLSYFVFYDYCRFHKNGKNPVRSQLVLLFNHEITLNPKFALQPGHYFHLSQMISKSNLDMLNKCLAIFVRFALL